MKVSDSIEINSTIENVWQKTIDVELWPKWNPVMKSITLQDGDVSLGKRAIIEQDGIRPSVWTVSEFVDQKTFSWHTRLLGMKMTATHELLKSNNTVRNELQIELEGLISVVLGPMLKGPLLKALKKENLNFKRYCEES